MVCRLCGSPGGLPFLADAFEYVECPVCGYIGLGRRFFPDRQAEKARYLLHRNDPSEPGYRSYLSAFVDLALAPHLAPDASILDFGSGPEPALTVLLQERGYRPKPYDPYFAPSRAWRRRRWDGVVVHEVAEHLREPGRSFAVLARCLMPGGVLAIRTRFAPDSRPDFAAWWYRRDSTHLGFFKPSSFAWLGGHLGLEQVLAHAPDTIVLRLLPEAKIPVPPLALDNR